MRVLLSSSSKAIFVQPSFPDRSDRKMFRKSAIAFAVVLVILIAVTLVSYSTWKAERLSKLREGSLIAETSAGKIEYSLDGQEGPVLLFLHGTPGGYDQAPDRSFGLRLLAPSRPGYLSTAIEIGRTPAEQAKAYAALLDALGIDEVIVMGASGGGPSAISFAAAYPERTRALVAVEAVSQSMGLMEAPGFMDSDFLVWLAFTALNLFGGPEGMVELLIPDPNNQEMVLSDPRKLKKVESILWSFWPPSLRQIGTRNDMEQFSDLRLPLGEISVPTLIIHGTADVNVPFSHAKLLAAEIPNARLHAITDADHMMPFSHDEEFEAAIVDFLARLEN